MNDLQFTIGLTVLRQTKEYQKYDYIPIQLEQFIERTLTGVPIAKQKELRETLRERLTAKITEGEAEKWKNAWRDCERHARTTSEHIDAQSAYLVKLACDEFSEESYAASGIATIWAGYWMDSYNSTRAKKIALGMLGTNNQLCAGAKQLDILTKKWLLEIAALESN